MLRSRERLLNAVVVGISSLAALCLVESSARVYRHFHPQPPNNQYAFREGQPLPYRGAWYFSDQFVEEMFRQPNGWFIRPNSRLIFPGDFHGRYFNIEQGRRRTTDSPPQPQHRVWVVGGSAIYSGEVPDSETIPSHLQRLLNRRQPGSWSVENLGSITVTTAQQLELLRTLPIAPGDIVIFFDGVNDVVQGIYTGDPQGWVAGENRRQLQGAGPLKALLVRINAKYLAALLQRRSAFFGSVLGGILNRGNLIRRPHLADPVRVAELARETARLFRLNLEEARRFSEARGAALVHFLQPEIYASARRTPYEERLVNNFYINPNGLETAFAAGYPLLREAEASLGGASLDLSTLLTDRLPGEEFYLDFCHVNHAANARIAAAMLVCLP